MNQLEQVVIFCAGILAASILAGCAGMTGMGLGGDEQSEIRYCGPDGKKNWEVDKSKGGYIIGPKGPLINNIVT